MEDKVNLADLSIDDLANFMKDIGQEKYRAKQVFEWIHRGVTDIGDMTNLSKNLRETLKENAYICHLKIVCKLQSKIDETTKYLLELPDGNIVESVLMKYNYGYSICISSQVGCRMGCKFCASTGIGFIRNLMPGEMLQEVLVISKDLGRRIGHVVMMGIGEPFDNYDNVMKFLEIINDKSGLNIGYRNITISTCGIVPKILEFAKKNIQVTLSISLHGANDRVRESMMPVNKKYAINVLMDACFKYTKITNRRITFEYALVDGVNDAKKDALELAKLIKGMLCHVNLIPINEVNSFAYKRSKRNTIEEFKNILISKGINATVRRELGNDIKAACGQLRRSKL